MYGRIGREVDPERTRGMKTVTVAAVATVIAFGSLAWAEPHGDCRGPHKGRGPGFGEGLGVLWVIHHPDMARDMGVTDEQIATLRESGYKTRQELAKLRADAELARLEVERLLAESQPNEEALGKAVDEAGRIETQIRKTRLLEQVHVRQILGEETVSKIRSALRERREERNEGRRERYKGWDTPPGPPPAREPREDEPREDVEE